MIKAFRDQWLDDYYFRGKKSSKIPGAIEGALRRKLDTIHVANEEKDLRVPPGNRFEHLKGKLKDRCSIRVNRQYRLIFQWHAGAAGGIYLDPHTYR